MRRLLFPSLLAISGSLVLLWLFPRFDAASGWQQTLDRAQAAARARAIATRIGIDLNGWGMAVTTRRNRDNERWLKQHPRNAAASLTPVISSEVKFVEWKSGQQLSIRFASDGHLIGLTRSRLESVSNSPTAPEQALPAETIAALLDELTGDLSTQFAPVTQKQEDKDVTKYLRTWTSAEAAVFNAEAAVQGGRLSNLSLKADFPASFHQPPPARNRIGFIALVIVLVSLVVLTSLGALVYFFFGIVRKSIGALNVAFFFFALLGMLLLANGLGGLFEDMMGDVQSDSTPGALLVLIVPPLIFGLLNLAFALLGLVYWGGGLTLYAANKTGRPETLLALLRGRIFTRPVGQSLTAGLLLGPAIAALPYLVLVIPFLSDIRMDYENVHRLFSSPAPALAALTSFVAINSATTFLLFLLFGFLVPWLEATLRRPLLTGLLTILIGTLLLGAISDYRPASFTATVITGFLLSLTCQQIYRRFDLLTLLLAGFSAAAVIRAAALLLQPAASLKSSGLLIIILLGLLSALAFAAATRGKELSAETQAALLPFRNQLEDQAERERLKAEFSVAQRAQQQMLPSETPQLTGFSIAALCRPSREVGGDLYDFIPLPEGKLGVVVADVSGKGVPASLYMTLTKGLMMSVAEEKSDPGDVLCEVNRHLYQACQRRMFVTLVFGVIDPATRTMTYARAGHNPPLWHKTSEQSALLLRPPGLGLGLNSGKSFDRILKVETIELQPHDVLFFYSDGITEAMNEHGEEYGEEKLMAVATRVDGLGADEILNLVLGDVSSFLGTVPPQDDQTLVVVRVGSN